MGGNVITINPTGFSDWLALMRLLRQSFAYMDGVIDPPSSLQRLSLKRLKQKAAGEDLYIVERDHVPVACLFGCRKGDWYYVGKLAVDRAQRRSGLARALIDAAMQHAQDTGLKGVALQTRVELRNNHRSFRAMGFRLVGASAHPGYDRATSLTFRKPV